MEERVNKDSLDELNKNNGGKVDEVLLPGFRFHPTDEELVGFYLKRKIQQRPLSIELIKQLDIYKFDPWDLPNFASTGEKECYFYCPRDRKYRNSARPNRVTGAGFWKATGTDHPIYSSDGNKCVGLKKSLVFYKGKAAKGVKTDWMMHEFRLPSLGDSTLAKRCIDDNLPANDSWAICRIFKKSNTISSRTPSHCWVSNPSSHTAASTFCNNPDLIYGSTREANCSSPMQPNSFDISELHKILQSPNNNTSSFLNHISTFKPIPPTTTSNYNSDNTTSNDNFFPNIATFLDIPPSYILPSLKDEIEPSKSNSIDISSMLLSMSSSVLGDFNKHSDGKNLDVGSFPTTNTECHEFSPFQLSQDHMQHVNIEDVQSPSNDGENQHVFSSTLLENQWDAIQAIGSIPISGLFSLDMPEVWKSSSSSTWDCAPPLSK